MISRLQKTFHTETWWGKTLFIACVYVLYWLVFYGSWFLIPSSYFDRNSDLSGLMFIIYIIIFVPLISFSIPYVIRKVFSINAIFTYVLHLILIILSVYLFIKIGLSIAFSNWIIG